MKVLIVGLIVLALSVAGVSTYLIKSFSSKEAIEELEKEAQPIKIRILVAAKSLRPGDEIAADSFTWKPWPESSVTEEHIKIDKDDQKEAKISEFLGTVVRHPIREGEPMFASLVFKRDEAGFLAGTMKSGMRAVAISVTPKTQVAGLINPGDYVDVLLTHEGIGKLLANAKKEKKRLQRERKEAREGGDAKIAVARKLARDPTWIYTETLGPYFAISTTTETILRNIKVLAIDQQIEGKAKEKPEGKAVVAKTVTLALTPKQAETVIAARTMGGLSLSLRGLGPIEPDTRPGTYTIDSDVSPLLKAIKRNAEIRSQARKAKKAGRENATAMAKQKTPRIPIPEPAGPTVTVPLPHLPVAKAAEPAPKRKAATVEKKKQPVVRIYRGGAAKTEEIPTK